jgi:hypothetical protein
MSESTKQSLNTAENGNKSKPMLANRLSLGFTDINGREIFTGDIIKTNKRGVLGTVEYGKYYQIGSSENPKNGFYANCYGILENEVEMFGLEVIS